MDWPIDTLTDWDHWTKAIARLLQWPTDPILPAYLFRGQSNWAWPLEPSLNRLIKDLDVALALRLEAKLLAKFRAEAHIHLPSAFLPAGDNPIAWWQIMQHYGAPTRMLDWSASPYVAAYFAVVDDWDTDGAIWLMHPVSVWQAAALEANLEDSALAGLVLRPDAPHVVKPDPLARHTDRTLAQQGHFTFAVNILGDQQALIAEAALKSTTTGMAAIKVIVRRELKPSFLHHLHTMNVSASSLIPGQDGLGRTLLELARLESKNLPAAKAPISVSAEEARSLSEGSGGSSTVV